MAWAQDWLGTDSLKVVVRHTLLAILVIIALAVVGRVVDVAFGESFATTAIHFIEKLAVVVAVPCLTIEFLVWIVRQTWSGIRGKHD